MMSLLLEYLLLLGWVNLHDDPLGEMQGQPRDDGDRQNFDHESPCNVRSVEIFSEEGNGEYVDDESEDRGHDHLPVRSVDLYLSLAT